MQKIRRKFKGSHSNDNFEKSVIAKYYEMTEESNQIIKFKEKEQKNRKLQTKEKRAALRKTTYINCGEKRRQGVETKAESAVEKKTL